MPLIERDVRAFYAFKSVIYMLILFAKWQVSIFYNSYRRTQNEKASLYTFI